MLDLALLHETSELLSQNFRADDIEDLGKIIFKDFNCHKLAGISNHITMSAHKCAQVLVEFCNKEKKLFDLIQLLVQLDESTLNGKLVTIHGLEIYLYKLTQAGVYYDFQKRKVLRSKMELTDLINWGSLKEGKEYSLTIASIDIVNNSLLVKKHGTKTMEKVYFQLKSFLAKKLYEYDGRLWNFAGDGGIAAFTFKNQITRGILCALDIQSSLAIFNINPSVKINEPLELRIGIDNGKIKFQSETGNIVSDVINFAAHLEKYSTEPGQVSISGTVMKQLNKKIAGLFSEKHIFEEQSVFSTTSPEIR